MLYWEANFLNPSILTLAFSRACLSFNSAITNGRPTDACCGEWVSLIISPDSSEIAEAKSSAETVFPIDNFSGA